MPVYIITTPQTADKIIAFIIDLQYYLMYFPMIISEVALIILNIGSG
jgi:hypothetical protein